MKKVCGKLWRGAAAGYVYVMLLLFPLFMHDGYFDITVSKFRFAVCCTLLFCGVIIVCYLLDMRRLPWRLGMGRLKYFLLFLMAAGISVWQSPYGREAFWGNMGRYCGLFCYLIYGVMLYLVLEFPASGLEFLYVAECAAALAGLVGVLNHYGLDPLRVFVDILPKEQNIFISTVGHMGLFAVYAGMMLGLAGMLFVADSSGVKSWFHSGVFLILSLAVPSSGTEAAYIGAAVFFVTVFLSVKNRLQLEKWFMLLFLFLVAHALIGAEDILLAQAKPLGEIGGWLCRISVSLPLCAAAGVSVLILWGFPGIVRRRRLRRTQALLGRILIVSAACGAGAFLVYGIMSLSMGNMQFPLADEWGNYRGYIWRKTLEYFGGMPLKHKLFGMGPDCAYQVYRNICTESFLTDYGLYYDNAHNEYLQLLLTHGALGLLSWLLWIGTSTVLIVKKGRRDTACAAVGAVLLIYEAMALVGIQAVNTQVMFVLFLGLGLRYAAGRDSEGELAAHMKRVMSMSRNYEERRKEHMTLLMRDQKNQEIGKEIGIGLGEKNRAVKTAETMLAGHEPIEKIMLYTGLGREEIEALGK